MNTYKILITTLLAVALMACQSTKISTPSNSATLYNEAGKQLMSTQEPKTLEKIQNAIATSEKTRAKLLPIYSHYIELTIDNKTETWLLSKSGYIKQKDNNQLYRLKDPAVLSKYLQ